VREPVLLKPEESEAIIPAIELGQLARCWATPDRPVLQSIDPTNIGFYPHILEVARSQPGTPIPQGPIGFVEALPQS